VPLEIARPPVTTIKPWIKYALIIFAVVVVIGAILIAIGLHYADPYLHARAVAMLEEKFHSDVEIKDFHISMFPGLSIQGGGLALHKDGRTDVPPLIAIEEFSAHAGISAVWDKPWKIDQIKIKAWSLPSHRKLKISPRNIRRKIFLFSSAKLFQKTPS